MNLFCTLPLFHYLCIQNIVDMKQKFFPILMIAATLVGCAGNKSKTTAEIDGIAFDSVLVDTVCHLTSDTNSPAFNIKLSLQYAKGDSAQAFNDSLLACGILMPDYMPDGETKDIPSVVNQFVEKPLSNIRSSVFLYIVMTQSTLNRSIIVMK